MVEVLVSASQLLLALVLVVLNGFFVASEFAYVRVRATAVEGMVEEGRTGAATLQNAVDNLDDYLAVTQLGITLASLGLGWIGEPAIASLIEPVLSSVLPSSLIHLVAFAIGFGVITFLHVVFGELAPKTIAIARAERIALLVSPPMRLCYYLFYPGLVVFNGTANFFTSLIGVPPASETDETLTEEEILMVLSRAGTEGQVDATEVEMIERVFELDDVSVREVMVPRPDVVSVPRDQSLADFRGVVVDAGHTRYPVVDEDGEEVLGYVDVKDLLSVMESGEALAAVTVGDVARDIPVVPETGSIGDLLTLFQREHRQMAGVIDEWGVFEGIVTVEDVIESIVGDIRDDFDVDARSPSIEHRADGSYRVDGGVALADVNDELGADLVVDDFGTIGGLVLDHLGRAPKVDDRFSVDGYTITVEAVDGARVSAVTISEDDSDAEGGDETVADGGHDSDADPGDESDDPGSAAANAGE